MHLVQSMSFVGEKPWHGLGSRLPPDQPIEVWKHSAGMDWTIEESEVRFITGQNNVGVIGAFPSQKVLYRSDTNAPLAVVSKRFMRALVECPVDPDSVDGLLRRVLVYTGTDQTAPIASDQAIRNVRALYEGGGRGATFASSRNTAWGLLNSVTEYVDHRRRARSDDHRRDAAWFGQGAQIKQKAWDEVMKLVA